MRLDPRDRRGPIEVEVASADPARPTAWSKARATHPRARPPIDTPQSEVAQRSLRGLVSSIPKAEDHRLHAGCFMTGDSPCSSKAHELALVQRLERLQRDEVVGAVDEDEVALSACQVDRVGALAPVPAIIGEADDAGLPLPRATGSRPTHQTRRLLDPKLRLPLAALLRVNPNPLLGGTQLSARCGPAGLPCAWV